MIHQFIYAFPKPGMTEKQFQDYWVTQHAVKYASKIPQIRKYLVDTRIPLPGETGEPLWSGVAEIWLSNGKEQLESLQTPEFLQGARLDEPNWAAFWRTIGVDTTAYPIVEGPAEDAPLVKRLVLSKRKEGMPLQGFREHMLHGHADLAKQLPGVRRYQIGLTVDGAYGVGEALLDCVEQVWFDSVDAAVAAETGAAQQALDADYGWSTETRYIHKMLVKENWIIGPQPR